MFGPAHQEAPTGRPRDGTFAPDRWHALARQWHPVATAAAVAPGPLGTVLLDERLVIWRGGERVSVAKDLCIHRGAQLSPGSVKAGELTCPYHGFQYSPAGACVLAPCTGSAQTALPAKLHLVMFPAVEASGLVWVRLAAEGTPAPPDLGGGDDDADAWSALWQAPARLAVEAIIDLERGGAAAGAAGRRVQTIGPFAGAIEGGDRTGFAVQPLARAVCRIFLRGPGARTVGTLLERLRPVVESLPTAGALRPEALLPGDLAVAAYRQSLVALDLE